ncbi:lipocalin family protein [Chryseobacterium caseinilyticum]|uniref:Lipocalin family protein n=1 Tax=Chryseobacterium caseinilyticum TaxID=2771428 RepID=A0ABR8Z802_9FLAO|nr:lipocalin family protein [Chryseobacterium caseinilyticum]MBD8081357.1 lipocalin family protein [Chryseobacterium caseinilyticum]
MKKHLLLFAFSALALNSCKDDDVYGYELDLLKGDWKTEKTEIISGADNTTVLSTDIPTGCSTKSTINFNTNNQIKIRTYSGANLNSCTFLFTEGTFTYNEETKDLVMDIAGNGKQPYEVVILSSSELRLKQKSGNIDINGDQKIDVTYIRLKR